MLGRIAAQVELIIILFVAHAHFLTHLGQQLICALYLPAGRILSCAFEALCEIEAFIGHQISRVILTLFRALFRLFFDLLFAWDDWLGLGGDVVQLHGFLAGEVLEHLSLTRNVG